MMLRELYDGKIIPGERFNSKAAEHGVIVDKIDETVKYIAEILSPDDRQRFQELSKLYAELSILTEREAFTHGFAMGVAVMGRVFVGQYTGKACKGKAIQ